MTIRLGFESDEDESRAARFVVRLAHTARISDLHLARTVAESSGASGSVRVLEVADTQLIAGTFVGRVTIQARACQLPLLRGSDRVVGVLPFYGRYGPRATAFGIDLDALFAPAEPTSEAVVLGPGAPSAATQNGWYPPDAQRMRLMVGFEPYTIEYASAFPELTPGRGVILNWTAGDPVSVLITDPQRQSDSSNRTFYSGIFAGIAGAAALELIVQALGWARDRRVKRDATPSGPAHASSRPS
jgi:hypothetical protein